MIKKAAILLVGVVFLFGAAPTRAQLAPEAGGDGISRLLSVAPAGFRPTQDGYIYDNRGFWLEHWSIKYGGSPDAIAFYYAPLHLPHGAVITGLTAYISDLHTTKSGSVSLIEAHLATGSTSNWVVTVSSPAGVASGFMPYSTTANRLVQNDTHAYYLRWATPMEQTTSDQIVLGGVQVGYLEFPPTSPSYYSLNGADFTPYSQENDYLLSPTGTLIAFGTGEQDFQAGINLPHNASIEQMTFYYYGSVDKTISATLVRTDNFGTYDPQGGVTSVPVEGNNSGTITFVNRRVDNANYTYWMFHRMVSGPIAYGTVIKYTPRSFGTNESFFSVATAAFIPRKDDYTYENQGRRIIHKGGGPNNMGAYVAPFSPPQDTSIDSMWFMVGNSIHSTPGEMLLLNLTVERSVREMWKIDTLDVGGWYAIGSRRIAYNPIDYNHNMYFLRIILPASSGENWVHAVGAKGEWAYKLFLPLGRKK